MTADHQQPNPSVSTAPAEGATAGTPRSRRRRLPAHVGPARTSTVLLAVAFLAIGVLYLFVKPPEPLQAADRDTGSSSSTPSSDPTTEPPATTTPTTTAPSSETSAPAESTTPESTTSSETPTDAPVESTPESTAPESTDVPTSEPSPTPAPTS